MTVRRYFMVMITWFIFCCAAIIAAEERTHGASGLDAQVSAFLNGSQRSWSDWNVPYEDGKILHDLVLKGFKNISGDRHVNRPFHRMARLGSLKDGRHSDDY